MKIDNLYEKSLAELRKDGKRAQLILDARRTITTIQKLVKAAGGDITEETLANTTLGDFAVIAAQNGLSIRVESNYEKMRVAK